MSTRGSVKIAGLWYYIGSDAYPSFALVILQKAVKIANSSKQFISIANGLARFKWINGRASKDFIHDTLSNEYSYEVNFTKRTVHISKHIHSYRM